MRWDAFWGTAHDLVMLLYHTFRVPERVLPRTHPSLLLFAAVRGEAGKPALAS
jgi:hypothetical protein